MLVSDVLRRLGHRVDAVQRLHPRVDEAPADGRVEHLGRALEGLLRLAHDERRAGHRLRAAGDCDFDLARPDRARRRRDRLHARGAEPVDRRAGNGIGEAREQQRHAGEIAVVLPRLIGRAEKHLLDRLLEARMAAQEFADRERCEIVGADVGERAAVAADRSPHIVADEGVGHRAAHALIRRTGAMRNRLATKAASVKQAFPAGLPPVT